MSDAEVAVPANYLQTRFVGLFHAVASKVFWAGFFWELFGECLADNKYHTAKYAFLTGLGDSSGVVAGHLLYFTALAGCSMDAPAQEWPAARLLGTASLATGTCWQPLVNLCLDDFGFGFLLTFFFVGAVSGVVFFAALRCGRLAYDDAPNNGLKVYHDASLALAIAGAEAMPGAAPDPRTRPRSIALFVAMGKAGKAAAKKKGSTKSKALLGKRCDAESMMVVDAGSPGGAAPLTGRQKHAEKVAAKRALRDEKASIKKQRLAMPKASTATRGERKALTTALKELSRPAEPAEPPPTPPPRR
ncbi:hypothetical protein JL721_1096 [Aureococcus anophagefferens]|nr:hypothetical protein JL721_1096 [Aureococcus anophagefferens]